MKRYPLPSWQRSLRFLGRISNASYRQCELRWGVLRAVGYLLKAQGIATMDWPFLPPHGRISNVNDAGNTRLPGIRTPTNARLASSAPRLLARISTCGFSTARSTAPLIAPVLMCLLSQVWVEPHCLSIAHRRSLPGSCQGLLDSSTVKDYLTVQPPPSYQIHYKTTGREQPFAGSLP